jgi:hypothetical protein
MSPSRPVAEGHATTHVHHSDGAVVRHDSQNEKCPTDRAAGRSLFSSLFNVAASGVQITTGFDCEA